MADIFWNVVSVGGVVLLCFAAAYGVLICAGERDFLLDRKADSAGLAPWAKNLECKHKHVGADGYAAMCLDCGKDM